MLNSLENKEIRQDDIGQVQVQEQILKKWLDFNILHFNKLEIDDPIVELVLTRFDDDNIYIYNRLRQCFWHTSLDAESFLSIVENNVGHSVDMDALIDNIIIEYKSKIQSSAPVAI